MVGVFYGVDMSGNERDLGLVYIYMCVVVSIYIYI